MNLRSVNSYGRNGMGYNAVDLYRRMPSHLRDSVTDVCVLNACSHSGLVEQAQTIFDHISNRNEHVVTTMVSISSSTFSSTCVTHDYRSD